MDSRGRSDRCDHRFPPRGVRKEEKVVDQHSIACTAIVEIPIPEHALIGQFAIVHAGAKIGKNVHIGAHSIVHPWAVLGDDVVLESHCVVGGGAVIGAGARLETGSSVAPDCELGAGAFLGPGARLLDRTRLPTREPGKPARVCGGAGTAGERGGVRGDHRGEEGDHQRG